MNAIRQPAVAGTFYPAQRDALQRQLAQFLSEAGNDVPAMAPPKAIIGPHAGYVYSGSVAARAYARLAAARGKIQRVVLVGPSHYVAFRGIAVDTSEAWVTPCGTVPLDTEAISQLRSIPMVGVLEQAHQREHALEVHVPFLQQVLGDFRLVPVVTGDAPPESVAALIEKLWGGPETLIVISTDLSHYLDYAACQQIDQVTAEAIERFDPDVLTPAHACGSLATKGLLCLARDRGMTIERLDLRNSGDTAGPRDSVVGYGAWALYESAPVDPERAKIETIGPMLIDLARHSILYGLNTGSPAHVVTDPNLPPLLSAPGAVFVTLRRAGTLRGCIGSVVAIRPLVVDVVEHAFNSAFRDWRFPCLGWLELAGLSLSVSVLTPPTPMQFDGEADLLEQLQPGVDGLIIEDQGRRSLFLPSVWEEVLDKRHFLTALKMKAGLRADYFSASMRAQRFRSIEVKGLMDAGGGGVRTPLGWNVLSAGPYSNFSK
jgi:AmmeMemoRadiSam system protein B/AmmeMemoRadiSam system protein A